jgi:leader peptidase (prepilin peptidase)/N-methyltransferase
VLALLAASPAAFAAVALLFGLIVGSFLNVVIYRLPIMLERQWRAECAELTAAAAESQLPAEAPGPGTAAALQADRMKTADTVAASPAEARFNLAVPRSVCPSCRTPIKAIHNIPILSYLALRGRCANCHAHISLRYPAVELACGLATAGVALRFGVHFPAACAALVTWFLLALAMIDLDTQLLPDSMTLPLLWAGILASLSGWTLPGVALPVDPRSAILGAAAGYLFLWSVYHVFRLATGKEGMGYGDFKLLGALGAWLGWQMLPLIVLLSSVVGACIGITLMVFKGRDHNVPLAFGPYLAIAGAIALFFGPALIRGWYL